jgi:transcriptional regulator with XRE-family HTH domain
MLLTYMATIEDAIRKGVLDEFELPDWEIRLPIRLLYVTAEVIQWAQTKPELHDLALARGGRLLIEHLEQMFCDFRCAQRPAAGDLRRPTVARTIGNYRRSETSFAITNCKRQCLEETTVQSFRQTPDLRRKTYLALAGSIESQLRDAYAKRHEAGIENQASLARKLGVGRSAINRRLTGQQNMTIESIADLVWALGHCIEVDIFDPTERRDNHPLGPTDDLNELDVGQSNPPMGSSARQPAKLEFEMA